MAKPRTLPFGNFKVYLGDGGGPETFSVPCGFTKDSLKLASQTSSTVVPDCDDPDAAAWEEKAVSSLSAQVQGSGVLAMAALATWRAWFLSAASKNVRIMFDDTGANGGGYFQGAAILTDLSFDADRTANGGRTQISVTIDNDGEWTWVDNA